MESVGVSDFFPIKLLKFSVKYSISDRHIDKRYRNGYRFRFNKTEDRRHWKLEVENSDLDSLLVSPL